MTKSSTLKNTPVILPKLIVFDLDYTLWPAWIDCTGGPPYVYDEEANTIINPQGDELGFFEHTAAIITLIKTSFHDTKIGIASRSTAPDWARKAIGLLRISGLENTTLLENVDYVEIYPGSKMTHFKALAEKSGIAHYDMLFFDDESKNKEVTKLGVHFVKVNVKSGITPFQFENALHAFAANAGVKQSSVDDFFLKKK